MERDDVGRSDGRFTYIYEHPELSASDLRLIRRHAPGARRILDVGAGRGGFCRQAESAGFLAFALDRDHHVLPIWRRERVCGLLADTFHLPFRPGSFDVVRAKEILEHVADPLDLAHRLRCMLVPGGLLVVHVPSPFSQLYPVGNFWDDYTHVRPLSRLGLRRLLEDAGMRVCHLAGYTLGRNRVERVLAACLSRILPHTYVAIARLGDEPAREARGD